MTSKATIVAGVAVQSCKKVFRCWEFHGRGDQMFGGQADDRILARLPDGSLKFLSSFDRFRLKAESALFDSQEEAETAGFKATERNGLIAGIED